MLKLVSVLFGLRESPYGIYLDARLKVTVDFDRAHQNDTFKEKKKHVRGIAYVMNNELKANKDQDPKLEGFSAKVTPGYFYITIPFSFVGGMKIKEASHDIKVKLKYVHEEAQGISYRMYSEEDGKEKVGYIEELKKKNRLFWISRLNPT